MWVREIDDTFFLESQLMCPLQNLDCTPNPGVLRPYSLAEASSSCIVTLTSQIVFQHIIYLSWLLPAAKNQDRLLFGMIKSKSKQQAVWEAESIDNQCGFWTGVANLHRDEGNSKDYPKMSRHNVNLWYFVALWWAFVSFHLGARLLAEGLPCQPSPLWFVQADYTQ